MTHREARRHIKNIIKKYFDSAEVGFANRNHTPKANVPYVCITLGSPVRDLFPNIRLVEDRLVSYYQTKLPVQVDLYTHGEDEEPDETGYAVGEDTAVNDLTDFCDYLESQYVIQWCHRINAAISTNGSVQNLTELITDTDYEFRAMVEFDFCFVHKAVGHAGIQGEESIKHPDIPVPPISPAENDGSEAGYITPDDSGEGVEIQPEYKPTPSGGRSQKLVEETETGYFTEVEIKYKEEKK